MTWTDAMIKPLRSKPKGEEFKLEPAKDVKLHEIRPLDGQPVLYQVSWIENGKPQSIHVASRNFAVQLKLLIAKKHF